MKKILTLVLLTFVSLASFAQSEFGGVILKQETQLTARANVDELILKASVQYKGADTVALQSVKLNLEGTTNISDVEEVRVYASTRKPAQWQRNSAQNEANHYRKIYAVTSAFFGADGRCNRLRISLSLP